MHKMSRERVSYLARTLVDEMSRHESIKLLKDREVVRQSIVHALIEELKHDEERQSHVLQRIASIKGMAPIGSKEWLMAFQKLMEEEYEKQGFDSF